VVRNFVAGLIAVLIGVAVAYGTQHPACRDIDYPYSQHTPVQLRDIAASCRSEAVAQLYYHRAYHAELLAEGDALSGRIPHRQQQAANYLNAYRLYIALIEAFAARRMPNPLDRVRFLNAEYERHAEVVELRLHGYDKLADRLEKQAAPN
jgi:hypothetical protein